MIVRRSIDEPLRGAMPWRDRWEGPDDGLIACWERGREVAGESPAIAARARAGELVELPWKGGVARPIKGSKIGAVYYLAMWQGLRGDDLHIDTSTDVRLVCARHGVMVVYTAEYARYAAEQTPDIDAAP